MPACGCARPAAAARLLPALLLALLVAGSTAAGAGGASGGVRVLRPSGVPEAQDEWVVEAGLEVIVECRGPGPLAWTFPGSELVEDLPPDGATTVAGPDGGDLHVLHESRREEGGAYRSKLLLPGAQRHLTGYYTCVLRDQPQRNDSVYIYVRDPENLFVTTYVILHLSVEAGGEALIDCRANDPRASVSLLKDGLPVEHSEQFRELGMSLRWDKRRGFSLWPVPTAVSWMMDCKAVAPMAEDSNIYVMLTVTPRVDYLPRPQVEVAGPLKFAVGGGNTTLTCDACAGTLFDMAWEWPRPGPPDSRLVVSEAPVTEHTYAGRCGQKNLTLLDVRPSDAGNYSCVVKVSSVQSNSSLSLEVVDRSKPFISFSTEPVISQERDRHAQWVVDVKAYPLPALQWFNPRGEPISSNAKYEVNVTKFRTETSLRINSVDLEDRGTYVLQANNGAVEERLNLSLVVFAGPAADLRLPVEVVARGRPVRARCRATGFPRPEVSWAWRRCPDLLQNCSSDADFEVISPASYSQDVRSDTEVRSELHFTPNASMFVSCLAANNISYSNDTQSLQITDLPVAQRALVTWGPNGTVVVGDPLELWCGALRENYTEPPAWFRQVNETNQQPLDYVSNSTALSMHAGLRFGHVSLNDSAKYVCRVDDADSVSYTLTVKKPVPPFLRNASFKDTEVVVPGDQTLTLRCVFGGVPEPTISWLKEGRPVNASGKPGARRVSLEEGGRVLHLSYVTEADEGEYTCRGSSRLGSEQRSVSLVLEGKKGSTALVVSISVAVVVLVLLVAPLAVCVYKERKLRQELVVAGLHNFEEGAVDSLNPELPADEQAELLPYDRKWELPRERLKLGKQLGAGAFGVVLKAEAQGLVEGEEWTTVAVKMVKRSADFTYLKALASELKIMVHLGRHLNVVNLLGACTSNLSRRELLVIVEYCRFGNLHNYLLRHRDGFIDQVDPATGIIDASIGAEELARANSLGGHSRVKYASLSFSGNTEETSAGSSSGMGSAEAGVDYRTAAAVGGCDSGGEAVCMSPTGGEEVALTSSGSAQPEWRSNYRGDYRGRVRPICTRDLLCWAYQVARGMQYLAQRKVLHGDLAARNILLADGNIVKICDFGLAKSMYKSDNYRKKGNGPLPVKWMAVESIRDRIFSTQSDVWSFGIVLWELFSLAQTPYPGMPADEKLYHKLLDGYRMECPPHATHELYRVMNQCWETRPVRRPTFEELAETLGGFLHESVRKHYMELDSAYIDMNEQWRHQGSDYLGMLGSPDYGNLVAPREEMDDSGYINSLPQSPMSPPADGYLMMRGSQSHDQSRSRIGSQQQAGPSTPLSAQVFSPRPSSQVFTFAPAPGLSSPGPGTPTGPGPLGPAPAVANPGYSALPLLEPSLAGVLQPSADNYVNVPQHRNRTHVPSPTDKDPGPIPAVDNPSYVSGVLIA